MDDAAGLEVLGQPVSIAGKQLAASMLLSHSATARALLLDLDAASPNDPETLRLLGLERLTANHRDEALDLIKRGEKLAGLWVATLRAGAIVRYALALSSVPGPECFLIPNPVASQLLRLKPISATLWRAWTRSPFPYATPMMNSGVLLSLPLSKCGAFSQALLPVS